MFPEFPYGLVLSFKDYKELQVKPGKTFFPFIAGVEIYKIDFAVIP